MHLTFYELSAFFFIYGFLGWCTEVCFQALSRGKLINRGFLNGPICPIYGVSVVVIIWLLEPLAAHGVILFLGSVILCSFLEWLTGFIPETLFHQRWWDYSKEPFNIGGYICLRFSIMWGLACVFVVYIAHPTVAFLLSLVPHTLGLVILCILGAAFLADCAATIGTMIGLNKRLLHIEKTASRLREFSDDVTEVLYEGSIRAKDNAEKAKSELEEQSDEFREKLSKGKEELQIRARKKKQLAEEHRMELERKLTYGQQRLLKAFPGAGSTRYSEAMELLKQHIDRYKKQKGGKK